MAKVIYVAYVRYTAKTGKDWYIDALLSRNLDVEYWDVVSLVRESYKESTELDVPYKRVFHCYKALRQAVKLQDQQSTVYVILVGYEWRSAKLYRELSKLGCRMVYIAWGDMPVGREALWLRIKKKLFTPASLLRNSYGRLWCAFQRQIGLVSPYEVIFHVGDVKNISPLVAKKIRAINLCDFDNYQKSMLMDCRFSGSRYAVFLDINLPYQSDINILKLSRINAQEYFHSLENFFRKIEKRFNLKVIIAAHPKARYGSGECFGRDIIHNYTPELVKDAALVLSHHSTSISYAVLNQKPIIFFYTNAMLKIYRDTAVKYITEISHYLGALCLNSDLIIEESLPDFPEVNLENYQNYKFSYLVSRECENLRGEDVFVEELLELLG